MKKAQSQIISTVVLILLVLAAIVIVMNFIIPFIYDRLAGADCIEYANKIEIRNNMKYTCFNESAEETMVQVHVGEVGEEFDGFVLEIGGATTKSFKITNETVADVRMYDGATELEVPGRNEERTYIVNSSTFLGPERPGTVKVYVLLKNGKTCEVPDTLNTLSICSSGF